MERGKRDGTEHIPSCAISERSGQEGGGSRYTIFEIVHYAPLTGNGLPLRLLRPGLVSFAPGCCCLLFFPRKEREKKIRVMSFQTTGMRLLMILPCILHCLKQERDGRRLHETIQRGQHTSHRGRLRPQIQTQSRR